MTFNKQHMRRNALKSGAGVAAKRLVSENCQTTSTSHSYGVFGKPSSIMRLAFVKSSDIS